MFWEIPVNCKMAVIGIQTSSCNISWRQGHEALWWSNLFQNTHDIYYIYSITKCRSPPLKGSYFLTPVIYTLKNCAFINCRSESDFLPNFFNSEISCRRHYIVYTLLYIWPQVSRNKLEHNAISISLLPIIFTTPYIIRTFPIIISSWTAVGRGAVLIWKNKTSSWDFQEYLGYKDYLYASINQVLRFLEKMKLLTMQWQHIQLQLQKNMIRNDRLATKSHGKLYKVTSEAMLRRKVKEETTIFEFSL